MNGNKARKLRWVAKLSADNPQDKLEVKANYKSLKLAYKEELKTVNK